MEKLKVCDRRCVTPRVLPRSQPVWARGLRDEPAPQLSTAHNHSSHSLSHRKYTITHSHEV